jgi:hypothetical protein
MAGVVLVAAAAGMSTAVRAGAAALPQAAFIGMGVMVLRERWRNRKLRPIRAMTTGAPPAPTAPAPSGARALPTLQAGIAKADPAGGGHRPRVERLSRAAGCPSASKPKVP